MKGYNDGARKEMPANYYMNDQRAIDTKDGTLNHEAYVAAHSQKGKVVTAIELVAYSRPDDRSVTL